MINNDIYKSSAGQKATKFFKDNLDNIILVILCIVYIAYGIATIEETHKTIFEIVATGIVSSLVGFTVKILRRKSGILVGMRDEKFLATTNLYGDKKEKVSPHLPKLYKWCERKNRDRLEIARKSYLYSNEILPLDYNTYSTGGYDNSNDKRVKKVLKNCRRIKVYAYSPILITNAYSNSDKENELLCANVKDFERKDIVGDSFSALLFLILFGYFTLGKGDFSWSNIIWCALQIILYLIMGQIKFNNAVYFVTEILRDKVKRVINVMDEFLLDIENDNVKECDDNNGCIKK